MKARTLNHTIFRKYGIEFYGFLLLIIPVSYLASVWLLTNYTEGDIRYYRILYNALANTDIFGIMDAQSMYTGSAEPVYGLIMWLGTRLMDRIYFISIFNTILLVLIGVYVWRRAISLWVLILLYSNFYTLVVLTSAERLKFALIFILLFVVTTGRVRYLFAAIAPLNHIQSLMLYISMYTGYVSKSLLPSLFSGKGRARALFVSVVSVFLLSAFIYFERDYLIRKAILYSSEGISETLLMLVLMAAAAVTLKGKIRPLMSIGMLAMFAYFVGDSRVNMMGYMAYTYFVFEERRFTHPVFLLISAYLSFKSIGYIVNVLNFGSGFLA